MNFIMGALIEISAYFVEFFLFNKYGRKYPMIFYEMINAAVCIVIAVISVYKTADSTILSKSTNGLQVNVGAIKVPPT